MAGTRRPFWLRSNVKYVDVWDPFIVCNGIGSSKG
jgi:hypothetical protein